MNLLSKSEVSAAKSAIKEIAETIRVGQDSSLVGGNAGYALFFDSLEKTTGKKFYRQTKEQLHERVHQLLAERIGNYELTIGYSGMLWGLRASGFEVEPTLSEFYQNVTDYYLNSKNWTGEYELFTGLCGIGVNLADGLNEKGAKKNAALLVQKLSDASKILADGRSWHTPANKIPSGSLVKVGHYNLGVAHGIPAIWVVLSRLYRNKVAAKKCRSLFNENYNWFESIALSHDDGVPARIFKKGLEPEKARLAWCYGDPGAGLALLIAANAFSHRAAEHTAFNILLRSLKTPFSQSAIKDAGLCHGSAGLAMIYLSAFKLTGEKRFQSAASMWLKQTLRFQVSKRNGVFKSYDFIPSEGRFKYIQNSGLLVGSAGVGLALQSATHDQSLDWGRALLLS